MPKEDHIELEGIVKDALGGGQYLVTVTGQTVTEIRVRLNGKMKQHNIRVIPGDKVKLAVSPYDMTHGMITFRVKR